MIQVAQYHDDRVAESFTPVETAMRFVELLYPDAAHRHFNCFRPKSSPMSSWFHDDDREYFCRQSIKFSEAGEVTFYEVCTPYDPIENEIDEEGKVKQKRLSVEKVAFVPGIYCDIDILGHRRNDGSESKENLPPREVALEKIKLMPAEVSLIVDSGGGFYPFWLFNKPFEIRDEVDRERIKKLLKDWEALLISYLKPYHGDSVAELARPLRMPGTISNKYGSRVQFLDGVIPTMVKRHTVRELEGLVDDLTIKEPPKKAQRAYEPRSHSEEVQRAISALWKLSTSRADDYKADSKDFGWVSVGFALHSIDPGLCSEWDRWSQQSPKYKAGECERKWKSFSSKPDGIKEGSLYHWARLDGWEDPREKKTDIAQQIASLKTLDKKSADLAYQAIEAFNELSESPVDKKILKTTFAVALENEKRQRANEETKSDDWRLEIVDSDPPLYYLYGSAFTKARDGRIELTSRQMLNGTEVRVQALQQARICLRASFVKKWNNGLVDKLMESATTRECAPEENETAMIASLAVQILEGKKVVLPEDQTHCSPFTKKATWYDELGIIVFQFHWLATQINMENCFAGEKITKPRLSKILQRAGMDKFQKDKTTYKKLDLAGLERLKAISEGK